MCSREECRAYLADFCRRLQRQNDWHGAPGPRLSSSWTLRPRVRPKTLSANAAIEAKSHSRGAGTVLVLGDDLGDDSLSRHDDGHLARSGIVADVTGRFPISVETSGGCLNPVVHGRFHRIIKVPDIRGFVVVRLAAADGLAKPSDDGSHILPDELIAKLRRRRHLLPRHRAAAQYGGYCDDFQNSHFLSLDRPDIFSNKRREQVNSGPG